MCYYKIYSRCIQGWWKCRFYDNDLMCLNTRSNRVIMSKGFTLRNNRRKQVGPEWAVKKKKKRFKKMVGACIVTYAVCASVCMCVCSCAVPEQREERAEGVHYRSLCGSDCPLLWESGNSTLQSRGLVTRWERGKEKKKGKRKKTQREREAMKTA